MASLEEIKKSRLLKLELLKKEGKDPYPAKSTRTSSISDILADFEKYSESGKIVTLAGRVMALRPQGALTFLNLNDGSAKIQGLFKNEGNEESFSLFDKVVDIGDFIEVEGTLFVTKAGEKTLDVKSWRMLTKSLLPLPEKWHGLQDVDERMRKRYLDILGNPELRELFEKKAKFWDVTRAFMKERGFVEVDTPTLELTTGGAEARPFKTHHNDFDLDVFLRISIGELWQKRLMAAGFTKTFEIGRAYRNEGSSPEHLQEFSNMEFYMAYADYRDGMKMTVDLFRTIAKEVFGKTEFTTRGHTFDLGGEWQEIDYVSHVKKETGIDVLTATEGEMKAKLDELEVKYEGTNRERLMDTLWKYCRKKISGPAFLIHHPKLVSPLAKAKSDNPEVVERAQAIIAGSELANLFSELNDPIDQRARFELQQKLIERGDGEAMMPEWDFVEMLEQGMPPTCGFGFGERLFAFLVDKSIRETQLFPLMHPKDAPKPKKKETEVAVAVLNAGAQLKGWELHNTVAHLSAAFGARTGRKLFNFDTVSTSDGKQIHLNIGHAIIIKDASGSAELLKLKEEAGKAGLEVAEFTREMLATTNDKKIAEITKGKEEKDVEFLGVLVFGPRSVIDAMTKDFKLSA